MSAAIRHYPLSLSQSFFLQLIFVQAFFPTRQLNTGETAHNLQGTPISAGLCSATTGILGVCARGQTGLWQPVSARITAQRIQTLGLYGASYRSYEALIYISMCILLRTVYLVCEIRLASAWLRVLQAA